MSNGLAKRLSRLEQRPTRACNCGKDSRVLRSLKEIRACLALIAKLETQKPRSVLSRASSGSETGEVRRIGLYARLRQVYGLDPVDAAGLGSAASSTAQPAALSVPGSLDQRSEPAPVVMKGPG